LNSDFQQVEFLTCLSELRRILYGDEGRSQETGGDSRETENVDPNKERKFRACMNIMDSFLGDEKGNTEMNLIDSQKLAQELEPST
jgi:hypothetical protein